MCLGFVSLNEKMRNSKHNNFFIHLLFIHLSVNGEPTCQGVYGIYVQGETLQDDKPLVAAKAQRAEL